MGMIIKSERIEKVVNTIRENNTKVRISDIARMTGLNYQVVSRILVHEPILLYEDDKGYLGIAKG